MFRINQGTNSEITDIREFYFYPYLNGFLQYRLVNINIFYVLLETAYYNIDWSVSRCYNFCGIISKIS